MWFLKKINDASTHYIFNSQQYIVGRKNADILITNDSSISRIHAIISVNVDGFMVLKDCKSKYSTFVNDKKLDPDLDVELKDNDVIKFGMLESVFRVSYLENFNVVCSDMPSSNRTHLAEKLRAWNGEVTNKWSPNCTHLTVRDALQITIKACCAIIKGQHIVKSSYWDDVQTAISNRIKIPSPSDYRPLLNEISLGLNTDFSYRPERRTLFAGKIFVFIADEYKAKMEAMILCASGSALSWQSAPVRREDFNKCEFVFVQNIDNSQSDLSASFNKMVRYMTAELKQRPIPQAEIALAIITCSCDTYCNPRHDPTKNLLPGRTETQMLLAETPAFQTQNSQHIVQETDDGVDDPSNAFLVQDTDQQQAVPGDKQAISETPLGCCDQSSLLCSAVPETLLPPSVACAAENDATVREADGQTVPETLQTIAGPSANLKQATLSCWAVESSAGASGKTTQSPCKKRMAERGEDVNETVVLKKKKIADKKYDAAFDSSQRLKGNARQTTMKLFVRSDVNANMKDTCDIDDNPFARKRKAAQDADADKLPKKTVKNLPQERESKKNDHSAMVEKEVTCEQSTKPLNVSEFSSFVNNEVSEVMKSIRITSQWLSKSEMQIKSCLEEEDCNSQNYKTGNEIETEEENDVTEKSRIDKPHVLLDAFVKRFKDQEKSQSLDSKELCNTKKPLLKDITNRSTSNDSKLQKNFKTFRKQKVIPVTNILPTSDFVKVVCGPDCDTNMRMPDESMYEDKNTSFSKETGKHFSSDESMDEEEISMRWDNNCTSSTKLSIFDKSKWGNKSKDSKGFANVSFLKDTPLVSKTKRTPSTSKFKF